MAYHILDQLKADPDNRDKGVAFCGEPLPSEWRGRLFPFMDGEDCPRCRQLWMLRAGWKPKREPPRVEADTTPADTNCEAAQPDPTVLLSYRHAVHPKQEDGTVEEEISGRCLCGTAITTARNVEDHRIGDVISSPGDRHAIGCPHCILKPGYLEAMIMFRDRRLAAHGQG